MPANDEGHCSKQTLEVSKMNELDFNYASKMLLRLSQISSTEIMNRSGENCLPNFK
jgi:hypothetical protein